MKLRKDRLIITLVLSVIAFIAADAYIACLVTYPAPTLSHLSEAVFATPMFLLDGGFSFCMLPSSLCAGLVAACAVWMVWAYSLSREGNYRNGEEHGSARWGTIKEGRKFLDEKHEDNNIVFTEHLGMALSRENFDIEYDRNKSVLVVGGSGSGKSRYYVLPNLMQCNTSFS